MISSIQSHDESTLQLSKSNTGNTPNDRRVKQNIKKKICIDKIPNCIAIRWERKVGDQILGENWSYKKV